MLLALLNSPFLELYTYRFHFALRDTRSAFLYTASAGLLTVPNQTTQFQIFHPGGFPVSSRYGWQTGEYFGLILSIPPLLFACRFSRISTFLHWQSWKVRHRRLKAAVEGVILYQTTSSLSYVLLPIQGQAAQLKQMYVNRVTS